MPKIKVGDRVIVSDKSSPHYNKVGYIVVLDATSGVTEIRGPMLKLDDVKEYVIVYPDQITLESKVKK